VAVDRFYFYSLIKPFSAFEFSSVPSSHFCVCGFGNITFLLQVEGSKIRAIGGHKKKHDKSGYDERYFFDF
jgi:hypothetical protein